MRSSVMDAQVTIERKSVTPDPVYGTEIVTWTALSYLAGSPLVAERFWAQVVDGVPGRQETVAGGIQRGADRATLTMRYRNDIDSSMRVTVHRDTDVVYQIIGGPAMLGRRKDMIQLVLETYTS